ncbi:MAG: dicarboxylate/amino acid:cation symporter, partial [Pseudomonadales bacterium]
IGATLNFLAPPDLTQAAQPPPGFWGFIDTYLIQGLFHVVGVIFIASLKVLVVPLVFVSLVCGSSGLGGDNSRMGSIATKAMLLYLMTTALAISIALSLALLVQPGVGIEVPTSSGFVAPEPPALKQVLINIFPSNPIKAMADGNMLQIIVFALLFGLAVSKAGEHGARVRAFFDDINEVIMQMVHILMNLAPYGVFCLIAGLFAREGIGVFGNLLTYFLTVVAALLIHALLVYGSLLTFLGRLNPVRFLKKMRPVQLFAFSTASSAATLPVTLDVVEHRLGVDNSVASFTVPLGATINMDGTAIMQGVATVFIAQAYGVDIGLSGYLAVIATATLASIGTAGVPGVGLIMLAMVLQQVNLPVEGIGMIVGVDRLLDMLRTAVNVTGDGTVSCLVAKSENALNEDVYSRPIEQILADEAAAEAS